MLCCNSDLISIIVVGVIVIVIFVVKIGVWILVLVVGDGLLRGYEQTG